ncbi:MAG: UDP-N-acetylmuramate dehydrogenase [Steroidobacteraceae bacterium]
MAAALGNDFAARVRRNERMSRHTSWHVGGPAELYFTPHDRADLAAFVRSLPPETPVHWIGLGSNLLVRDGGLKGAVIALHGALERLERLDATTVYSEAGVACARIARQCIKWRLGPAEFFAGIPGTFGGALAMNAGAFGGETWRHVIGVETLDRAGVEHGRACGEYEVSYRRVRAPVAGEGFLAARLRFEVRAGAAGTGPAGTGQRAAADAAVRSLLERRKASQPIGAWSCGSVFTNPPGDHAARLIEAAGLKGFTIGDASVSMKHANFIINHGAATATDIERLIEHVAAEVERVHGVRLEPEVRIVGEAVPVARGDA